MKLSQLLMLTLKEIPKEATIPSHILMLRASLISKQGSGVYSYLPLGLRVMNKICSILSQELENIGAQAVQMPHLLTAELWKESTRYEKMGKGIFSLLDRHQVEYILGPTHEEVVVDSVKSYLQSYKQLPLNIFQITKKFRDEIRPRYGVMRGREFLMMDGYSFHSDDNSLNQTYQDYKQAYQRFFTRVGLTPFVVNADSGAMGGSKSEEFMVGNSIGDDIIFHCRTCLYYVNLEKAAYQEKKQINHPVKYPQFEKIQTPDITTIKELGDFFQVSFDMMLKSVLFQKEDQTLVLALIKGDRELNEAKLLAFLEINELVKAESSLIQQLLGEPGFLGPIDIEEKSKVTIILDSHIQKDEIFITGSNQKDFHYTGVKITDFEIDHVVDISNALEGDICASCNENYLETFKGIEVGHVFQLGDFYSRVMNLSALNQEGKPFYPTMGCYGIGVDRTFATIIEENYDEYGIIFPLSIAPYHIIILILEKNLESEACSLYNDLKNQGYDVLIDDRNVRPGVKMKDADLIGIPIRITFGKYFIEHSTVGFKERSQSQEHQIKIDSINNSIQGVFDEFHQQEKDLLSKIKMK